MRHHSEWTKAQDPKSLDDLGAVIVFSDNADNDGKNLYEGARKIVTPDDPNHWVAEIQKNFRANKSTETWEHSGASLVPQASLRIPYMFEDKDGDLVRDHILVGFTTPSGAATPTGQWRPKKRAVTTDLQRLAEIIVRMAKTTFGGDVRPQANWKTSITTDANLDRRWPFRGVICTVHKSLSISYSSDAGSPLIGQILVGYEGGGGY